MNTTTSVPNVTNTVVPTTTLSSPTTATTTTIPTTLSPTTTLTPTPTSSPTNDDNPKLEIILPCAIIGGLILIAGIAILCYIIRRRLKQRTKQSPPILPSFTFPDINDLPNQTTNDPPPVHPNNPPNNPLLPPVPPSKDISVKPVLETRESVVSVTSDGYFLPCAPPKPNPLDEAEYIDMTQQYLPKPCGTTNKGYVNDPKNPQTNIFTNHDIPSHYQNTGNSVNSVPDMNPMGTVHQYANINNTVHESTKRPTSDIYENTNKPFDEDDDHQLLDYENAPPKVSPNNVNTNENFTTNNFTTQIKPKKPLPSPRTNRPKTSPRESPRSKSSPRGSPHSNSSPRRSPMSQSSPRTNPEKHRGVKVM